jgi:hypothetical protein
MDSEFVDAYYEGRYWTSRCETIGRRRQYLFELIEDLATLTGK